MAKKYLIKISEKDFNSEKENIVRAKKLFEPKNQSNISTNFLLVFPLQLDELVRLVNLDSSRIGQSSKRKQPDPMCSKLNHLQPSMFRQSSRQYSAVAAGT